MKTTKTFNFLIYTLTFLIIFFTSAIISSQIILKGEMVSVPSIIGKTMPEARTELIKKRLSIVQKDVQLDNNWGRGKIISQDPSPGSKVKIGKIIKVILSAGSEKVILPRLIGKNFESISPILKDSGLRRGKVSQVHTRRYAAGKIISQHPHPSEEVGRNSQVSLLVSQGEKEKKYLMPDLIGNQSEFVIKRLKEMEFRIGDMRYSYYPGLDSGIIIKQSPPHGFLIQKNFPINLEVSK